MNPVSSMHHSLVPGAHVPNFSVLQCTYEYVLSYFDTARLCSSEYQCPGELSQELSGQPEHSESAHQELLPRLRGWDPAMDQQGTSHSHLTRPHVQEGKQQETATWQGTWTAWY